MSGLDRSYQGESLHPAHRRGAATGSTSQAASYCGALKVPDLFGPLGDGVRGPIIAGSLAAFVAAYLSVRFLERYFRNRTLIPFAVYCIAFGAISFVVLAVR